MSTRVEAFMTIAALALASIVAAGVLGALGCKQQDVLQVSLVSSVVVAILSVGVAVLVREK